VYTKSGQHVWLTEETEDYSVGFMVCPIETWLPKIKCLA
jgi:hypothetical protein